MATKVERLWAFVGIDRNGDEGVAAFRAGGHIMVPMVSSDEADIKRLAALAQQMAEAGGTTIELRRYDGPPRVMRRFAAH